MNRQDFEMSAGIEAHTLEIWLEQRWLIPDESPAGPDFTERDLARARLIHDLKGDFSVNDEGVDLILHLIDQIHSLRAALGELRESARSMATEAARGK
jgi:chaperone modulatory protein CbpM